MALLIQSPAKCEVHSITQFLNAKGECPAKTHDVVQRAGGKLLWLGDTEAGSKT